MKSTRSNTRPPLEPDLAGAAALCRTVPGFLAALREILAAADREIAAHLAGAGIARPCLGGGGCCKFDLAGHRLYVSAGELALLAEAPPTDLSRAQRLRCPWQAGPSCAAYARRPLGCRTHFCRPKEKTFFEAVYEQHHREIRALHQSHCTPYAYGELTRNASQLLATK